MGAHRCAARHRRTSTTAQVSHGVPFSLLEGDRVLSKGIPFWEDGFWVRGFRLLCRLSQRQ